MHILAELVKSKTDMQKNILLNFLYHNAFFRIIEVEPEVTS